MIGLYKLSVFKLSNYKLNINVRGDFVYQFIVLCLTLKILASYVFLTLRAYEKRYQGSERPCTPSHRFFQTPLASCRPQLGRGLQSARTSDEFFPVNEIKVLQLYYTSRACPHVYFVFWIIERNRSNGFVVFSQ